MELKTVDFSFVLLTPCFSGTALGKNDDHAEMRIPPIRGHVRFWHRELFDVADANRVWGSTSGDEGQGSRVALRFAGPVSEKHASPKPTMLPHKPNPNQRGPRPALAVGESFTLRLQRLVGCAKDDEHDDWDHAQRALKLWLIVGSLGLRSNRAAGSVWSEDSWAPRDMASLKEAFQSLGLKNWCIALVGFGKDKSPDELRETASDTIQGNPHRRIFGGINDREPSPTKFKVVRLGQTHCLLAAAPVQQIQGHGGTRRTVLQEAEHLLWNVKPNPSRWQQLGAWNHLLP